MRHQRNSMALWWALLVGVLVFSCVKTKGQSPIAARLKELAVAVTPAVAAPNTNTVGIHAVWSPFPFADSYDLAWGTNVGDYPWTLNTVTTGAVFRWPQTNPLPVIVVRATVANQTSDWSAPFMLEKYVRFSLVDVSGGAELASVTVTNPTKPVQLIKAVAVASNNYPTLP